MGSIWRDRNMQTLGALLVLSLIVSYSPHGGRPPIMAGIAEPVVLAATRPLQKAMWLGKTFLVVGFPKMISRRGGDVEQLRSENARLRRELRRLQSVDAENERLRRLLEFRQSAPGKWTAAHVSGRSPSTWLWQMAIDRGSQDGVRISDAVCVPDGLIGQVVRVDRGSADVLLITDWDSGVGAVDTLSGAVGIIKGRGEPNLLFTYMAEGSEIHKGDIIETSGLGGVFPAGQQIGTVIEVHRDRYSTALSATVEPSADFRRLSEVLVHRPG